MNVTEYISIDEQVAAWEMHLRGWSISQIRNRMQKVRRKEIDKALRAMFGEQTEEERNKRDRYQ